MNTSFEEEAAQSLWICAVCLFLKPNSLYKKLAEYQFNFMVLLSCSDNSYKKYSNQIFRDHISLDLRKLSFLVTDLFKKRYRCLGQFDSYIEPLAIFDETWESLYTNDYSFAKNS